jgi:hypothetical protein
MACHTMDGIFWALHAFDPYAVEAVKVEGLTDDMFPKSSTIKWEYKAKGNRPAFVSWWYDGEHKPPRPEGLPEDYELDESGNVFVGTRATILVEGDYGDRPRIIPEEKAKEIGKPRQMLERSPGHYKEWVMAANGEQPANYPRSNFLYAGPMTEVILLGNLAMKAGKRMEYDADKMRFTNDKDANKLLTKEYRMGWDFL